jgi:hypothetical protein
MRGEIEPGRSSASAARFNPVQFHAALYRRIEPSGVRVFNWLWLVLCGWSQIALSGDKARTITRPVAGCGDGTQDERRSRHHSSQQTFCEAYGWDKGWIWSQMRAACDRRLSKHYELRQIHDFGLKFDCSWIQPSHRHAPTPATASTVRS